MRLLRSEVAEALPIAREALGRYSLRTFLSVLGIVLGVAAVIAMMSVTEGARRQALAQVAALGLENVVARSRGSTAVPIDWRGLRAADGDRLQALIPLAESASPVIRRYVRVTHGGGTVTTTVLGVAPSYAGIRRLQVARGRFLADLDMRVAARHCVLGHDVARRLFGFADPLGATVTVGRDVYLVVGVLPAGAGQAGATSMPWHDAAAAVFVPLPTLAAVTIDEGSDAPVDEVWIRIGDGERAMDAGRLLHRALAAAEPAREVDVLVPRELLEQRYRTQRTFNVVVGSVAALALLVGGIGIMNMMLTSVIERTREIGVRRTVGATRRSLLLQFLLEAVMMTLAGGAAGVVAGVALSWAISAWASWATHVSVLSVVLGLGVAVLVGLLFGLYPALKAADLAPVDAMRYE